MSLFYETVTLIIKGFIIGIAFVIPGVSGVLWQYI